MYHIILNKFVHCWYLCWQPGVLQTKKRKEIVTTHGETQKLVHGHLIIPVSQVIAENSLGMHTSCFLHRSKPFVRVGGSNIQTGIFHWRH